MRYLIIYVLFSILITSLYSQTQWTKYSGNPVYDEPFYSLGQPSVLFENDTFKMYHTVGWIDSMGLHFVIGYAYSLDGIFWNPDTPVYVLYPGGSGEWDDFAVDASDIIKDGIEYKLYYTGKSLQSGIAIGLANSSDGINWIKEMSNPILTKGNSGEWDDWWVESPTVIYDSQENIYKMWYTGVKWAQGYPKDQIIRIGYAVSSDGIYWTKDTVHNPVLDIGDFWWDDGWVAVSSVIKRNGIYEMWYSAISKEDWSPPLDTIIDTFYIGYAYSTNGYEWTKYPNPVLTSYDPPSDLEGPWAPDVIFDGNIFRMWYETKDTQGIFNWICYAESPVNIEENKKNTQLIPPFINFTSYDIILNTGYTKFPLLIEIFDKSGRVIKRLETEKGNLKIPFSSYPSENYFLLIKKEKGEVYEKYKLIKIK